MYQSLQALDTLRLNFSESSLFVLNITLAFIMFGVALELKVADFKRLVQMPKLIIVGSCSQMILVPALTFILVISLNRVITPAIALGMILVAACPGGNISNFFTNYAKGNTALAVSLTGLSTILATFVTPLNFSLWGKLYILFMSHHEASTLLQPIEIDFLQMFRAVLILLGIPMILGIFVSNKFPNATATIIKPIKNLSLAAFAGMVIMALSNNYQFFLNHIKYIFIIVLIHNAFAFIAGFWFATFMKLKGKDRKSITIETGIHNTGLGLVLLFNPKIFPPTLAVGGMAFIAAWWGIWHIISGLSLAAIWNKSDVIKRKLRISDTK